MVAMHPQLLRYLEHQRVQRRLSERTLTLYAQALGRLETLCAAAGLDVTAVQPHHVRGWSARLHAAGQGPRTLALTLSAWRGLYRWMGKEGLCGLNPVDGVRAPKAGRPLPKALSVDQAVALAKGPDTPPPAPPRPRDAREAPWLRARDHCIVELLYGCGLRSAELLGLDLQPSADARGWVEPTAGEVRVLGKGGKWRSVPLGPPALAALRDWLGTRATLASASEPALFVGRLGARLSPAQLRSRLKQLALEAGLPTHVHPHMLRHSFASHVLQSSGDLRAVQELLGHAQISTTQIYTRLDFQHLAKVYDAAHPRARRK